jgi:transcriptional regulator
MYIPKLFNNEDSAEISDFINQNSFAILINQVNNRPWGTHIPLLLEIDEAGNQFLFGHISKANEQWKTLNSEHEVLAIFSGPNTYISSSWYNHENVPTWNYTAVHAYGKATILTDEELYDQLGKMMRKYEANSSKPKVFEKIPLELIRTEMKGIVGIRIAITEIQAVEKLSQNRDVANHKLIVEELEKSTDYQAQQVAKEMKRKNQQ